jgi:hypothetical protein
MIGKIQRVELDSLWDSGLFCLFCGQKVLDGANVNPCPDTLFVATSEGGFEFRSARLNAIYAWQGLDESEIDVGDGCSSFTDQIPISDAIKITLSGPAPSGLQVYVGFALAEATKKNDM